MNTIENPNKDNEDIPVYKEHEVLAFWFDEYSSNDWFKGNETLDTSLKERFSERHEALMDGLDTSWKDSPEGALSAIIILDQFSRNMNRDTAESFLYDDKALEISRYAIAQGFDTQLEGDMRAFMYMPFMHSESKEVHEEATKLFGDLGIEGYITYEKMHKDVIDRFGRYPHRNEALGRESTEEELEFLSAPDSSF